MSKDTKKRIKKPIKPALDRYAMKRIERTFREGVSFSANWREPGAGPFATTAIHWRPPVDPSGTLARTIIDKVTRHTSPMPLELDGHLFLIQAVDGRLVGNGKGGVELQLFRPAKPGKHRKGAPASQEPSGRPASERE